MTTKDFHGWLLDDAATEIDNLVGDIRSRGNSEQVCFITGEGKHKEQVLEMMREYGIEARTMLGNSGCVVAEVE